MAFFALAQYNPEGHDASIAIIKQLTDVIEKGGEVHKPSAWLAAAVEDRRRIVYPDGEEHAGQQSIDVSSMADW